MINIVENIINKIAFIICIMISVTILTFSTFFSANYNFSDYPYFSWSFPNTIIYIIIAIGMLLLYMYIGKKLSYNIKILFLFYFLLSMLYIIVIPLEPFSDMKYIYDIAINGLQDSTGYLTIYNNQIPITIYLWIITSIFGKSIIVPKIFNIIFNFCTLVFIHKIYSLYNHTNEKSSAIMWFSALPISVILYSNHIYNDILFTFLTIVLLFLILQGKYNKLYITLICFLSVIQYLIRPSGIIYIIAIIMYFLLYHRNFKICLIYVFITITLIIGINKINENIFDVDSSQSYPIWSFIQMGINEEEFGFQDGTHSIDWSLEDCMEKYKKLGVKKVLKIFAKKELWMWSEGTYQAERYGFGDYYATYTHENAITQNIRDIDNSIIRISLEKLMKAQYYVYTVFALIGFYALKDKKTFSILLYIICGFFCFYLIWEIKSRYIFSLYPILMYYSYNGWKYINNKTLIRNIESSLL